MTLDRARCVARREVMVHFLTGERLRLFKTFTHAPQLVLESLRGFLHLMLLN